MSALYLNLFSLKKALFSTFYLYFPPTLNLHCQIKRRLRCDSSYYTLLYRALIWSDNNLALQPCWRVCMLLKIRAFIHSAMRKCKAGYLFEGCYFCAFIWSTKMAKIKCLLKYQIYSI